MSNRESTGPFAAPRFIFLPAEFRQHVLPARREQLLAVRSLLDAAIHRLEETEEPKTVRVIVKQAE